MMDGISIAISAVALLVSLLTAWLTLFRKGTIRMTQPTMIAFLHEGEDKRPKVFLRALLYSTAQRGHVVAQMFVRLSNAGSTQTFAFWGHGDGPLVRGSGVFVGMEGMATNHHFLPLGTDSDFRFKAGTCVVTVYVKVVGQKERPVTEIKVGLTDRMVDTLNDKSDSVMFDWCPDKNKFVGEINRRLSATSTIVARSHSLVRPL